MTRQQLTQDSDYARDFADALSDEISDWGVPRVNDGVGAEVNVVETYTEAGVLTRDAGLVLHMSDGAQVRLTIQAYVPAGRQS